MSKWLWVIAFVALAALFYYSQNPPAEGSNAIACSEGDFLEGYCDENVYYFDECVDGFYRAAQINCSPSTCNAKALEEEPASVCVEAEAPTPSLEAGPKPTDDPETAFNEEAVAEWFAGSASCGDGYCVQPENCASCPGDCQCGEGDYCREEWGSCELLLKCGDGACREGEECCSDCGCGDESVCDSETQECVELPETIPDAGGISVVVADYLFENGFENQSIALVSYYASNGEVFALVITNCLIESETVCDLWVTVNSTGDVVSVAQPA